MKFSRDKEDIRRTGLSSSVSLSSMECISRFFGAVDAVDAGVDGGGERRRESGVGDAGRRSISLDGGGTCNWRAPRAWKSLIALRWKDSLGTDALAASLSFAVRVCVRTGWGATARLITNQCVYQMKTIKHVLETSQLSDKTLQLQLHNIQWKARPVDGQKVRRNKSHAMLTLANVV